MLGKTNLTGSKLNVGPVGEHMTSQQLEQMKEFVGPSLPQLLRSKEVSEEHLGDADPKIRWAAVILMTYHWDITEKFKSQCELIALHDPDPSVRTKAIGCLGFCYARSANGRIEKLLAHVVCNDGESHGIRQAAYMSLLMINGGRPMPPPASALNLRIPEDVDWVFVHSMLELGDI
jgi:hypothetical protein